MNTHTPGPWSVLLNPTGYDSITAKDCRICDMPGWDADYTNEEIANARLIAAAPDLLAALKWCKSQGFARYTNRVKGSNDDFCDAVDRMDAAIAKATGGAA